MNKKRNFQRLFLVWILLIIAVFTFSITSFAAQSANDPPAGLSLNEWMKIQSEIRKASYNIEPADEGDESVYTAANRKQGYDTKFHKDKIQVSPRGKDNSEWKFSMRLTGYGYGDDIQPVLPPEIVTTDNRVEYRRGNITEWYVNEGNGLEQGFTIQKRLEEKMDEPLKIQMHVDAGFTPILSQDRQSIAFKDNSGQTVLKYHKLSVIDAEQKKIPAYLMTGQSNFLIVVQENSAVYPLIVDPVIIWRPLNQNLPYVNLDIV